MDRHQMRSAEFWTAVHAIVIVLFAFFMFIVGIGIGYNQHKEEIEKEALKKEKIEINHE